MDRNEIDHLVWYGGHSGRRVAFLDMFIIQVYSSHKGSYYTDVTIGGITLCREEYESEEKAMANGIEQLRDWLQDTATLLDEYIERESEKQRGVE